MDNILLITFVAPETAHEAMCELRLLNDAGAVKVHSAAVVEREFNGLFTIREDVGGAPEGAATAAGGVVGALIGAFASPAGLLLGGVAGAALGALVDEGRSDADDEDVLIELAARLVPPGAAALLAEVGEPSTDLLDAVVDRLGGSLVRRPRAEVERELAAAAEAGDAAQAEARRVMRERRHATARIR